VRAEAYVTDSMTNTPNSVNRTAVRGAAVASPALADELALRPGDLEAKAKSIGINPTTLRRAIAGERVRLSSLRRIGRWLRENPPDPDLLAVIGRIVR